MKIPLKWLADYVPLPASPAELARKLTLAGLEVGGFRSFGLPVPEGLSVKQEEPGPVWDRDKIITAAITRIEKHPDADKLKLPFVLYGVAGEKQLVTGAPNISVGEKGQKVILALTGSILFDGHAKEGKPLVELKPTKIRGIPSDSMLCSAFELGITDEHEGIILLEDDAPVGVPLADFMGDLVLEIDVLPNMARCLAMVGVAREVAALTGGSVTLPVTAPKATGPAIADRARVSIADAKLSPRYACALIEGVKIGPSPGWMQRRLQYAGVRPISNIVDVTNYVMLEWGQPLHAFDYDALVKRAGGKPPHITVRPATPGEKLVTLDGVERTLTPEMLVIADDVGAVALAGVMGGRETEVSAATTNVLLESANFDFLNVRRTMRALQHSSEAGLRFSRGLHPDIVPLALGRAAELMRLHAGGTVAAGVVDVYPAPQAIRVVELKSSEVRRLLGIDVPLAECAKLLTALEFQVEVGPDSLTATVPPYRLDIQDGPADLIEDIARLVGYDRLPSTMIREGIPEPIGGDDVAIEEKVRDRLVTLGLQEVINYSLTTPEKEAPLGVGGPYVELVNPISSERSVMRRSVAASVLESLALNLRQAPSVRLFEVGSVYLAAEGKKLPDEPRRLAVAMAGRRLAEFRGEKAEGDLDFFDLKGVVEALLEDLHLAGATYRATALPGLHPGKGAEIVAGGRVVGTLGELHPTAAEAMVPGGRTILLADLDLAALRASIPPRFAYAPPPKFPAALRDVAVVVPAETTSERVEAEIRAGGGALLKDVRLFDLYTGAGVPEGKKSLAYALSYQADDRTLNDKDVDKAHKGIEGRLKHVLKAEIRGRDA